MEIYSKSKETCHCKRQSNTYNTSIGVKCFRCISEIKYLKPTATKDFIRYSIIENERLMNEEINLYIEPYYEECKEMREEANKQGIPPYQIRGYISNVNYMIEKTKQIQKKYFYNPNI